MYQAHGLRLSSLVEASGVLGILDVGAVDVGSFTNEWGVLAGTHLALYDLK